MKVAAAVVVSVGRPRTLNAVSAVDRPFANMLRSARKLAEYEFLP
jgi:hypothetical protein